MVRASDVTLYRRLQCTADRPRERVTYGGFFSEFCSKYLKFSKAASYVKAQIFGGAKGLPNQVVREGITSVAVSQGLEEKYDRKFCFFKCIRSCDLL